MPTPSLRDFDAAAATWDDNPFRRDLNLSIAAAIQREVALRPDMIALDFGCGTGQLSVALAAHVAQVVALDTSAGMLEVLQAKLAAAGVDNVTTLHADLTADARLDRNFDVIVSGMALHHIPDPGALLCKLADALAAGGHLCLADLDAEDGSFHPDPTGIFHHGFSAEAMQALFTACDLRDIRSLVVHTMDRPQPDGTLRAYPVLLTVGLKP